MTEENYSASAGFPEALPPSEFEPPPSGLSYRDEFNDRLTAFRAELGALFGGSTEPVRPHQLTHALVRMFHHLAGIEDEAPVQVGTDDPLHPDVPVEQRQAFKDAAAGGELGAESPAVADTDMAVEAEEHADAVGAAEPPVPASENSGTVVIAVTETVEHDTVPVGGS